MFQFRIPKKQLCPKCRKIIDRRYKEYRRLKQRAYMHEWRLKNPLGFVEKRSKPKSKINL